MKAITILIPTHERANILRTTLENYKKLSTIFRIELICIIVDSSKVSDRSLEGIEEENFRIIYQHHPGLHFFEKLSKFDELRETETPIVLTTDDDLLWFSEKSILKISSTPFSFVLPRSLFFRKVDTDWICWEGLQHLKEYNGIDPINRINTLSLEGPSCVYGMFSPQSFSSLARLTRSCFQHLSICSSWSIIEDITNLHNLLLVWTNCPDSWFFRVIDRKYNSNKSWKPSWKVLNELSKDRPDTLNLIIDLIRKHFESTLRVKATSNTIKSWLNNHTVGYMQARSRKWGFGPRYMLRSGVDDFGKFAIENTLESPIFLVGRRAPRLSEVYTRVLKEEWVCNPHARVVYQASGLNFLDISKEYTAE